MHRRVVDTPGFALLATLLAAAAAPVPSLAGGSRTLSAVPQPQPSSGWCAGAPTSNYGTVSATPGSCLGDVAAAAGWASPPSCPSIDTSFTVPYLHFHVATPCSGVGSTARVYLEAQLATTAGARYGLGLYLRTDSPVSLGSYNASSVGMNGACVQERWPLALGDLNGDACGDLNGTGTCVLRQALNLTCANLVASGGTGDVTVPVCVVWSTSNASATCAAGMLPSGTNKCACYLHTITGLSVAGNNKGILYAPLSSTFPLDMSAGGPAPPAPTSSAAGPPPAPMWCGGQPPFNWGTSSLSNGSCPGDVWHKWGGKPGTNVQCVSQDTDVTFDIPALQYRQVRGCSGPGSKAAFYFKVMASTFSTATLRYNLGIYMRIDTPVGYSGALNAAGVYGTCVQETLSGGVDMDGDGCGDLNKTAVDQSSCVLTQLIEPACVDLDNDGLLNVPLCMTWSTGPTNCATAGMLPSSASKCVCTSINIPGVLIYGSPDNGKLPQPTAPLPPNAPPVAWPQPQPPPPRPPPPPSPPGVGPTCPAGGANVFDPAGSALPAHLINGGFELPLMRQNGGAGGGDYVQPASSGAFWVVGINATVPGANGIVIPGWRTNASDGLVEMWSTGYSSVPAAQGAQFVENSANIKFAALFQDVATTPGVTLAWAARHRGRYSTDTAMLTLGPPAGPYTFNTSLTDGTSAWGTYTGTYLVPAGQTVTRLTLVPLRGAASTGYQNTAYGNFLDDVQLTAPRAVCCNASVNAYWGQRTRFDLSYLSMGLGLAVSDYPRFPQFGKALIGNDRRSIIYTPSPGFFGADSLVYRAADTYGNLCVAGLAITVLAPPPPPPLPPSPPPLPPPPAKAYSTWRQRADQPDEQLSAGTVLRRRPVLPGNRAVHRPDRQHVLRRSRPASQRQPGPQLRWRGMRRQQQRRLPASGAGACAVHPQPFLRGRRLHLRAAGGLLSRRRRILLGRAGVRRRRHLRVRHVYRQPRQCPRGRLLHPARRQLPRLCFLPSPAIFGAGAAGASSAAGPGHAAAACRLWLIEHCPVFGVGWGGHARSADAIFWVSRHQPRHRHCPPPPAGRGD